MLNAVFGFISGIISGMGIGGGVILIPLLAIFTSLGQHEAQGINLLYFLPSAACALFITGIYQIFSKEQSNEK